MMIFRKFSDLAVRRLVVLLLLCGTGGCSGLRSGGIIADGPAAAAVDYRLEAGDELNLQVYREPQLSGIFCIDASGQIRHPLCGSLQVRGLTLEEVEAQLTELLGERYLVNPKVVVSIQSAQGSHVVILGEVKNPGVHPIPFGESMTLLQAIAEAGGFTDLASVNRVTLVRSVDGEERSIRVKVSRMISGQEPDLPLLPNDVIMVPQVIF